MVEVIFPFFMRAAQHLYFVSLVFLLLVVSWGGADTPEGGAVNPVGGSVNPEGGAVKPEGGAVNPEGGAGDNPLYKHPGPQHWFHSFILSL